MTPDIAAAAERTEAAQRLIDQAQDADFVELVTVSALELCVLGGPKHPLFDETVARAWMQLGDRRRKKLIASVTDGMVERGLLIENPADAGPEPGGGTYSLKPELGIALAARCKPAFIVTTETAVSSLRTPRFFALGDQNEPVRGVVVEEPAALTADLAGDFPNVKKLGPLGRFYRYVLVSQSRAAAALAELVIAPATPGQGATEDPAWIVSIYRHYDGRDSVGFRLSIRSDGTKAHLDSPSIGDNHQASAEYDLAGLSAAMLDLITVSP